MQPARAWQLVLVRPGAKWAEAAALLPGDRADLASCLGPKDIHRLRAGTTARFQIIGELSRDASLL